MKYLRDGFLVPVITRSFKLGLTQDNKDQSIKRDFAFGNGNLTLGYNTASFYGFSLGTQVKGNIKLGENWIDMTKGGQFNRGRVTPYIGLLHQEYSLYPSRTILGNLTDAISLELPGEFAKITSGLASIPEMISS